MSDICLLKLRALLTLVFGVRNLRSGGEGKERRRGKRRGREDEVGDRVGNVEVRIG
jgi:hypothetical protein